MLRRRSISAAALARPEAEGRRLTVLYHTDGVGMGESQPPAETARDAAETRRVEFQAI